MLGLHLMNSPATARRGNQLSAAGMAVAVADHGRRARSTTGAITATRLAVLVVGARSAASARGWSPPGGSR